MQKDGWELTASGSLNEMDVVLRRSFPAPLPTLQRRFAAEFAPRLSLSRKWKTATVYASVARGFSPLTTAELLPRGSDINLSLAPEKAISYDLGFRIGRNGMNLDVNAFLFRLRNTIVQRRDAAGGDSFINAGSTLQKGIETSVQFPLLRNRRWLHQSRFWASHSCHGFRYTSFQQLATDFSGKRLPGVAPHTVAAGLDAGFSKDWLINLSYFFSSRIPLNDDNSSYANGYHLLHVRLGYQTAINRRWLVRLSAGVENLLNTTYSLGNDINAFGGR